MHEDDAKKTLQIESVAAAAEQPDNVIPAQPGQKPPEPRLQELDRAQLNELWLEAMSNHNSLVALQIETRRLEAEQRIVKSEFNLISTQQQQLQEKVNAKLREIRQKYNIPEGWGIDSKTGLVTESEPSK